MPQKKWCTENGFSLSTLRKCLEREKKAKTASAGQT
jgi:hypothetical protein